MSTTASKILATNAGAGAQAAVAWPGGKTVLNLLIGSGSTQLEVLGSDGSTWIIVGTAQTTNGVVVHDLAPGQYRMNNTTGTGVYAVLVRVP